MTAADPGRPDRRRLLVSGLLFGLGAAGAVDEIVFHQLLHWHHFYDRASGAAGLVSDGLLHAATWSATVAGLALLADVRRRRSFAAGAWWGAVLVGAGAFQVWDGVVHHKLLRLHQVRYGVDLTGYDVAWIGAGALVLLAGVLLLRRARTRSAPGAPAP
ncbi:DUF2243 domain-containing protein [Modestobacter sp. VKM Ac-2979]|uniref:DUF2243 domain-containing protein n=1 Tax=unclassified Modestobacter TaxID=2643866 RepID=UPI0022AB4F29|nr:MULTISPECIES: DUF2243 domain-containing protein [unclassified Modestobacter]MCZ2810305.1 DUF2243 domain-containing protein [Modestobacter sp. VKM Ac-2979]MCZ2841791.1 DUF2243 domain-containing protein [Modestobacter sp. VKM Ac-2980]